MIDLHAHILPGLDDGARTMQESLRLARAYAAAGYRKVIATPHMVPGTRWMPTVDRITAAVDEINQNVAQQGIALEIAAGMEVALDPQIPKMLDDGCILTLGGTTCLLIEPSSQQLPPGWDQVVFSIQSRGYSVLLAHPERCMPLADDQPSIARLRDAGVYFLMNWGSLSGRYGRTVARKARSLLQQGLVHCLATDSHRPEHLDPDRMDAASRQLRETIGEANARLIGVENPRRVLAGEPLQAMAASAKNSHKRRWWKFW